MGYLEKLREICSKNDILLIFDEVITGFGMILVKRFKVRYNDISKGYYDATIPMGAIGVKSEIYDTIYKKNKDKIELFHGYTYSGHPIACAAGIATLEVYEEEKLFERSKSLEKYFGKAAHSLSET